MIVVSPCENSYQLPLCSHTLNFSTGKQVGIDDFRVDVISSYCKAGRMVRKLGVRTSQCSLIQALEAEP